MSYHVNRAGKNLGMFPLDELRRRRGMGELDGSEMVWRVGMNKWEPIDDILAGKTPTPPPLRTSTSQQRTGWIITTIGAVFLVGIVVTIIFIASFAPRIRDEFNRINRTFQSAGNPSEAMDQAAKPITGGTNATASAQFRAASIAFRQRQYVEGYRLRGMHDPELDDQVLKFLDDWIIYTFGGEEASRMTNIVETSDLLAARSKDPLVLTAAALATKDMVERQRRLERALAAFPDSKHRAYPRLVATLYGSTVVPELIGESATTAGKIGKHLDQCFNDGSFTPDDQEQIAEILINGWGMQFFRQNHIAVGLMADKLDKQYRWLSLVLKGEHMVMAAWDARGGGYANTVSQQGWQTFQTKLAEARNALTEAWKLRPDIPIAPSRMIYVSLGDSGISEMRLWFDRALAARFDDARAYKEMRWGLRPRWYGSVEALRAFGIACVDSGRYDTDVPRKFFDAVEEIESESDLEHGEHIYGRPDLWPHFQRMYEGYLEEPSVEWERVGWRSTYAVMAYLAGDYDTSKTQLEKLNWTPKPGNLLGWQNELSLMSLEVAARTSAAGDLVANAEASRRSCDLERAREQFSEVLKRADLDSRTLEFARHRLAEIELELRLAKEEWVDFLTGDLFQTVWAVTDGKCDARPDGSLDVHADREGHFLYSRVRVGANFEMTGEFEIVSSTTGDAQVGLLMGLPDQRSQIWYGMRWKRNRTEKEIASFSQNWSSRALTMPIKLGDGPHKFSFKLENWKVTTTLDAQPVIVESAPGFQFHTYRDGWMLGLGADGGSNETVVRYRNLRVRRLPGTPEDKH